MMEISYPFSGKSLWNEPSLSAELASKKNEAFENRMPNKYPEEKREADEMEVPRAEKGTEEFFKILREYKTVKWTYTVYRKLFIVPLEFRNWEVPHSIAAENMPVFCAGTAYFKSEKDGILTVRADNYTGHYEVPPKRASSDIMEAWSSNKIIVHPDPRENW